MSSVVAIQTNTVTFAPGTVARQREVAVQELDNYIPIGTYLSAAFGTEAQYALDFLQDSPDLHDAILLPNFIIVGSRVYLATEYGMEFLFRMDQYALDDTAVWSSTFVEGDYWLCYGGHAVWQIDGTLRTVTDVTAQLPYVPLRIESAGLRLILGTNDTVSWSSQTDRLDFSSTGTGAGSQAINVLGAYGNLLALGKSPDGFIIYTTRGILVAANTDNADIPYSFQTSILPGYELIGPYAQTSLSGHQPVAIFKGRGLCKISIANEFNATAVVETINPFIGQAEGINTETIRAYPYFGGYIAFDTDSAVYFMDSSAQTFGMMSKTHWIILVPNTAMAMDFEGRVFKLSLRSSTVIENAQSFTVLPENCIWCDAGNLMDSRIVELQGGRVPTAGSQEGFVEEYVCDYDFSTPALAELVTDGFDCMDVPMDPVCGKDYQQQWESIGNVLPVKLDTHESVPVLYDIDMQPPEDVDKNAVWEWWDYVPIGDSITVTYGAVEDPTSYDLVPSATFTGIRVSEADANLHTRCNNVVLYEYEGSDDKLIDCNVEDGVYDCNAMPDEIWEQTTGYAVSVSVDGTDFTHQKGNLFTGHVRDKNHTITVRGARVLSEIRATLIGGGIK